MLQCGQQRSSAGAEVEDNRCALKRHGTDQFQSGRLDDGLPQPGVFVGRRRVKLGENLGRTRTRHDRCLPPHSTLQ